MRPTAFFVPNRGFVALACVTGVVALTGVVTAAAPVGRDSLASPRRVHLELDHANIAVGNLSHAAFVFRRMGFTLKSGRPHVNSIANQHLKFLDGGELELITAIEPHDVLAEEYVQMVRLGDGGAFVALRTQAFDSLVASLARAGQTLPVSQQEGPRSLAFPREHALHSVWFFEVLRPWIDRPEFTTHANSALGLRAAWLSSRLAAEILPLFAALGYQARSADWPVPQSTVIALDVGEIYLVPLLDTPSHRPLIGVTIAVQRLDAVEGNLAGADVNAERHTDRRGPSLRVPPAYAQGIWLEFLEARDTGTRPE